MSKQDILPDPLCNPNLPVGCTSVPIHPISVWPAGRIPVVLTFPGEIDPDRLIRAIEVAASIWPTIAGRLAKTARKDRRGEWDYSVCILCYGIQTRLIPIV
jgi:hypothetical protein